MAGLSLVRSWSWVSFANLQEARFPILQESAYTTDSDTELSLVYGLLLIASPVALAPVPTAHVYSASKYGIVSMQGHDGLFARRLPIAFSCFSHLDIRGFCRRRFDRFAIVQVASQSWLRVVSLIEHVG